MAVAGGRGVCYECCAGLLVHPRVRRSVQSCFGAGSARVLQMVGSVGAFSGHCLGIMWGWRMKQGLAQAKQNKLVLYSAPVMRCMGMRPSQHHCFVEACLRATCGCQRGSGVCGQITQSSTSHCTLHFSGGLPAVSHVECALCRALHGQPGGGGQKGLSMHQHRGGCQVWMQRALTE